MDYLTILLIFLGGMFVGHQWCIFRLQKVLKQYANDNGIILEDEDKPRLIVCSLEIEDNQYYLYDKNTHSFYCQSNTLDGLAEALKKNKNIDHALVVETRDNIQRYWLFKDGKSGPAKLNES